MTPIATLPVSQFVDLHETGGGIRNRDGSECEPWGRLSGPLHIGPFHLHVEAYAVVGMEWERDGISGPSGYAVVPVYDAFTDEVEACYAANGDEHPESQQINGRWYVMRAFPFAE